MTAPSACDKCGQDITAEEERDRLREALVKIEALIPPYEVTTDTELEREARLILRAARPFHGRPERDA